MRNKRGQMWAFSLMLGITIIVLGLALAPAGKRMVDDAMNTSTATVIGLDCNNESISNFAKGTCVITDYSLPYFFGGIILVGVGIILARFTFIGGQT